MGAWGIKALERDEGLDVLDILKNEYVPEHPVMDLGEMIELMKEEVTVSYTHLNRRRLWLCKYYVPLWQQAVLSSARSM